MATRLVPLSDSPATDEWSAYHAIRRTELFESRGRSDYDPHRPEERARGRQSLLLKVDDKAIGTARLDVLTPNQAVVRLVAITHSEQGKGYGRLLMNAIEILADSMGVTKLLLNATPSAVGFYKKLGYQIEAWADPDKQRPGVQRIQMSKKIH